MKKFKCPVCGYSPLLNRSYDYSMRCFEKICVCCGTHRQLIQTTSELAEERKNWMTAGYPIYKSSLYPSHFMDRCTGQITKTQLIRQFNSIGLYAEVCLEGILMKSSP